MRLQAAMAGGVGSTAGTEAALRASDAIFQALSPLLQGQLRNQAAMVRQTAARLRHRRAAVQEVHASATARHTAAMHRSRMAQVQQSRSRHRLLAHKHPTMMTLLQHHVMQMSSIMVRQQQVSLHCD